MSATRHTPGPWKYVPGGDGNYPTWNVRIGSSLVHLPGAFDMKVMDANARLIAAAPDLLSALKSAANYIDNLGGDSRPYRIEIAAATGASQ